MLRKVNDKRRTHCEFCGQPLVGSRKRKYCSNLCCKRADNVQNGGIWTYEKIVARVCVECNMPMSTQIALHTLTCSCTCQQKRLKRQTDECRHRYLTSVEAKSGINESSKQSDTNAWIDDKFIGDETILRITANERPILSSYSIGPGWVSYADYLHTHYWRKLRSKMLRRAENKCQVCSTSGPILQVHHNTYARIGDERMTDLFVLCGYHHAVLHTSNNMPKPPTEIYLSRSFQLVRYH
jgi:hypothetical protein